MEFSGFIGPTYSDRCLNANAQRLINWYPEIVGGSGRVRIMDRRTPGVWPFVQVNASPIRALWTMNGRTFCVAGNHVAELYQNGRGSDRGVVAADEKPATICSNGTMGHQVFICSGGYGYIYDTSAGVLSPITDTEFPYPVWGGAFCDGYFIALQAGTRKFFISDLLDGTSWNGLDVAEMSTAGDNLLSFCVSHRELWLFGSQHTHVWYDSGDASFPFQPVQGASLEHGILAPWSVASLDNTLYWVGQDVDGQGMVWKANGYTPERVSTHAVEYHLSRAGRGLEDAIAWTYQEEGHSFYVLYVPTLDTTWVYDVATGMWHERAVWNDASCSWEPYYGRCHCLAWGQHLVGDRLSGKIYRQSLDYLDYDDVGFSVFLSPAVDPYPADGSGGGGSATPPSADPVVVSGVNGWYPAFSPNGGAHLASGNHQIYLDGVQAVADGTGPTWMSETEIVYSLHSGPGVRQITVAHPTSPTALSSAGYNRLAAGGGHWYGEISVSPFSIHKDGAVVATDAFGVDCDDAGRGAWLTGHDTSTQDIVVDGTIWATGRPTHGGRVRLCRSGVIWQEGRSSGPSPYTVGLTRAGGAVTTLQASHMAEHLSIPVDTPSGAYILSVCDSGLILRKWGATRGWTVTSGDAYYPDAAWTGSNTITCAWSTSSGVLYTRAINIATDAPADLGSPSVSATITVPVIGRACWFGYFKAISVQYGDNLSAPQNCTQLQDTSKVAVWNQPGIWEAGAGQIDLSAVTAYASQCIGLYVEAGDATTLAATAAALKSSVPSAFAATPIIGTCDGFLPTGEITGCDWLGIECYTLSTETAAQMEARVRAAIAALPTSIPLLLIGLSYTSNATHTQNTTELLRSQVVPAAIARDCPQVRAILMFSDGRPTGTRDHESWRPIHAEILAGITGEPTI